MPTPANPTALAQQARRSYAERLLAGIPAVVQAIDQGARLLAATVAEPAVALKRRELLPIAAARVPDLAARHDDAAARRARDRHGRRRRGSASCRCRRRSSAGRQAQPGRRRHDRARDPQLAPGAGDDGPRVVGVHRPALAHEHAREPRGARHQRHPAPARAGAHRHQLVAGRAARLRCLARAAVGACTRSCRCSPKRRTTRPTASCSQRHVLPEVDLRPFIRRSNHRRARCRRLGASGGFGTPTGDVAERAVGLPAVGDAARARSSEVGEETRLMTRAARPGARQRPGRGGARPAEPPRRPPAARLRGHLARAGAAVAAPERGDRRGAGKRRAPARQRRRHRRQRPRRVGTPALLEELHQRKQALKQAAATPVERATIEIVALLFQSILMEDAIPATVRVWFARLQMPVLRVAVSEPDFFATVEHPARRLIDRMGSCVMGFDSSSRAVGDLLEKEIKRVVQVVEAYPDTGRRVFQTVLTEFEKFLEHYFKNENEASKKGVSLAAAGRAARDDGDPVHDRAAQDAQRRAGAGRRARVPVPGLGRRAGDDRGQVGQQPTRPRR